MGTDKSVLYSSEKRYRLTTFLLFQILGTDDNILTVLASTFELIAQELDESIS
jgi:hypothetical protein